MKKPRKLKVSTVLMRAAKLLEADPDTTVYGCHAIHLIEFGTKPTDESKSKAAKLYASPFRDLESCSWFNIQYYTLYGSNVDDSTVVDAKILALLFAAKIAKDAGL